MVTQTFNLHLIPDAITPKIYLEQYDKYLNQLAFNLVNGSEYYTIPSGTYVSLVGKKPDGTAFSYACTWSGHTVTIDITDQITAVPGTVHAQLRFTNGSGTNIISSKDIELVINRSPLDGTVCSRNDFVDVDKTLMGARSDALAAANYKDQAQAAATDAKNTKNTAVAAIDSAKASAISDIGTSRSSAINAITTQQSVSVNAVNTAGNNVSSAIASTQSAAVASVNSAKNTAISAIDNAKTSAVSTVQHSIDNLDAIAATAEATVNNTKNSAVSTINSTVSSAVQTVNNTATTAVSDITRASDAASDEYYTAREELLQYSQDPNAVLYEYYPSDGSIRVTGLGAIGTPTEPNSVVYSYDSSSNSLTLAST